MKRILLIFSALFIISTVGMAQKRCDDQKREKFDSLKVAYITEKLSLTEDESSTFIPVYEEFHKEMRAVRKQCKNQKLKNVNIDEMTDEQVLALMNERFDKKARILEVKKKYHAEFLKLLPVKKVYKLYEAEHNFRKEMVGKVGRNDKGKGCGSGYGPRNR